MVKLWRRNSVRSNRSFVSDPSIFNFNKLVMLVKCSQLLNDVFVNLTVFVRFCMFVESSVEASVSLSYIGFRAPWTGELIYDRTLKFLWCFVLARNKATCCHCVPLPT